MPVERDLWEKGKKSAWIRMCEDLEIGYLDEDIRPLLLEFFKRPCSYTKSSCSGRIVLVDSEMPWERKNATVLFKKHSPITVDEIMPIIEQDILSNLWIIASGPIIHVVTCSLKEAMTILKVAHEAGFKHSGIISFRKDGIFIELVTGIRAEVLLKTRDRLVVKESELPYIVDLMNRVLAMGKERLNMLYSVLRRYNEELKS